MNPPDSSAARAPRYSEAESPPSVCASGTNTSSLVRPFSTSAPSGSDSSYCPSSIVSGPTTATGTTATPVSASWAFAHGETSIENTSGSTRPSSACCRAATDSGSLRRGHFLSSITPAYQAGLRAP